MNILKRPVIASTGFEDIDEAVNAVMKDAKQKKLYEFMKTLAKDDQLVWLEGVLDCADAFGLDCAGLQYVHDEMYELGEDKAITMIDNIGKAITSSIDIEDKPFLVVTQFADEDEPYEEIIYAFNARTAKMIANSVYKNRDHEVIDVRKATPGKLRQYPDKVRKRR